MGYRWRWCGLLAVTAALGACVGGDSNTGPTAGSGAAGDDGSAATAGGAGSGGEPVVGRQLMTNNVDKLELLFVVDNSASMLQEQASLRRALPRMIRSLTQGQRFDGAGQPIAGAEFPPVHDLHIGVVSTDMGLPGVPGRDSIGCGSDARLFGDDGVLQHNPNPAGASDLTCLAGYPAFLLFVPDVNDPNTDSADQFANDVACVSALGANGCGFAMPLEAMLRALWPSDNVLPDGSTPPVFADGKPFMTGGGSMSGRGGPTGTNTGFARFDRRQSSSLLAVVVVSDADDCSSWRFDHFTPPPFLADDEPLKAVSLNLRCWQQGTIAGEDSRDMGEQNLFGTTRYAQALKALRPSSDLVVFAGIVGVPTSLVNHNIDIHDVSALDAYYARLLSDPALVEQPDPATMEAGLEAKLVPSCVRGSDDPNTADDETQRALPPRRIIKVAKELGTAATVESICADDFAPAIDSIIARLIAPRLGGACFPESLARDADGLVDCDVYWELPPASQAEAGTPTACAELGFLSPAPADHRQVSATGGAICQVTQIPVVECAGSNPACMNGLQANADTSLPIQGWFYDDFTSAIARCGPVNRQRIGFRSVDGGVIVERAPPSGVVAVIECAP